MPRMTERVKLKPFSEKYIRYYNDCFKHRINCLEGAYRAGKSVINILSFANHIDHCTDRIHLVSGASVGSARLNVSDCNGLGLLHLFAGRCRNGKYEGNECLFIKDVRGKEKIVIFVGGGKSDSYKKIQGLSFGSWLSVELANLYISDDDKDFIAMALSRLTQSEDQRIWWDLNPTYPSHKVYTKYLDVFEKLNNEGVFQGGFNLVRCSLFDNKSLSEEQIQNALSMYPDKDSVDYKRNILGQRSASAGIIFYQFASKKDEFVIQSAKKFLTGLKPQFISVGIDFGGNGSNTTFVASLICNNVSKVFVLIDDMIDMSKTENANVKTYRNRLRDFLCLVHSWGIAPIRYIFGDCADPVMINETTFLVRSLRSELGGIRVCNCSKRTIHDRIDLKKAMLDKGNYHIFRKATHVINSTETQVWDSRQGHEDERLDNGTCDIDTADAEEYSWSGFYDKLLVKNTR